MLQRRLVWLPGLVLAMLAFVAPRAAAQPLVQRTFQPMKPPALPTRSLQQKPAPPSPIPPAASTPRTVRVYQVQILRDLIAATPSGSERIEYLERLADTLDQIAAADLTNLVKQSDALAAHADLFAEPDFANYPRADTALLRHANLLIRMNRLAEATASLTRLLKHYPASKFVPDAYLVFAETAFSVGDLKKAQQFYEKVLAFPKSSIATYARYKLAWVHLNLGKFQEALLAFDLVAQSSDPILKRAATNDLPGVYAQVGRPDRAFGFFQRVDPSGPMALYRKLGARYQDLGKFAEAVEVFRDAATREADPAIACGDRVQMLRAVTAFSKRAAIIAAAADVVRGLPVGVVDCAIEADEIIGDLAMVWHVELGGKHGGDPREAIAMWERAVVAATTPGRRTAAVHDRAILLWAQAQRGGTAEWIDAAEAMQSPDAGTVADAAIDAWDNAIRAARGARLDPALAARARAGLGKINSDRARILLASVR